MSDYFTVVICVSLCVYICVCLSERQRHQNCVLKLQLHLFIPYVDPCPNPLDIIFLVDASNNVGPASFERVKDFIANVTSALPIGENGTRVGAIAFSDTVQLEIPLDRYFDAAPFQSALQPLSSTGTPPNMRRAFTRVIDAFLGGFGARSTVANRIVILLTASPADDIADLAQTAKDNWITVYAIGIGISEPEVLSTTVEDATRIDVVPTFEDLSILSPSYGEMFCSCCECVFWRLVAKLCIYVRILN